MKMIGFLIGLMVGGFLGITLMALMQVASDADRSAESRREHSAG